ncbi:MAG TPA: hypothetical protein VHN14_15590 [Kofleriaceae bacterium]|jgi:hypothetical protein|nr:hypothetical protein [Kofleriaceae bacterium]
MTRFGYILTILVGASLGVAACSDSIDEPAAKPDPGSTTGGDDTTFDHDNDGPTVWELIDRLTKEGPPSFTSHVHSCSKVRIATLGQVLTSVGVNLGIAGTTTAPSAGDLYKTGASALGASSYANRIRENIGITTSGASREFDIFAAGADQIIAAVPTLGRCQVGGVGPQLFNGDTCTAEGITCLIGTPAQTSHVQLCNLTITGASDPTVGKRLAVAALLAAAYTCE